MQLPRLAIICDLKEEQWPSMDLAAEMLFHHLKKDHVDSITPTLIRPAMKFRFQALPLAGKNIVAFTYDRIVNRFLDYPAHLKAIANQYDLFHIIDHSYSQLAFELPSHRTIVTCHDLDTFRSILEPRLEQRSIFFQAMSRKILEGLKRAKHITCDSHFVYNQLRNLNQFAENHISVVQNGADFCSTDPLSDSESEILKTLDQPDGQQLNLLHVGSTIPRKRIDLLFKIVAAIKESNPNVRLVKAGGKFTSEQLQQMKTLGLSDTVIFPDLSRTALDQLYGRCFALILCSEREGFGLPLIEALLRGTPVVVTDIPVLREVGEDAASYCELEDVSAWKRTILSFMNEKLTSPKLWELRKQKGIRHASTFRWSSYTNEMMQIYKQILGTNL